MNAIWCNGVVKIRWSKIVFAVLMLMGLMINSFQVLAQPETLWEKTYSGTDYDSGNSV